VSPWLCKAGVQLREMVDDNFPSRSRRSDGWIGDSRHSATKSDHNPAKPTMVVRAVDISADLGVEPNASAHLANQIRLAAKKDKRISYVIFNGRIASKILFYRWRKYSGVNPHTSHIHISFTKKGDKNSDFFEIPMLGGNK
jgi:hypothetical protein